MKPAIYFSAFSLALCCHAFALEPRSEHTFQLSAGETPPDISLDDLHWIIGNWTGTIFDSSSTRCRTSALRASSGLRFGKIVYWLEEPAGRSPAIPISAD